MAYDEELGSFEGSVYYSKNLPKGKGDVKYNKQIMDLLLAASDPSASKATVADAQKALVGRNYLDPTQIDSTKGPILMGAIQRYKYNANSVDRIFQAMDTWKDNFLK